MKTSEASAHRHRLSVWVFIALLVVVATLLVLLNVVHLPDRMAHRLGYTGKLRLFALDLTFTATPSQMYALLAAYGSQGRRVYAAMMGLFDVAFPFLYGSCLSVGLRLVARGMGLSPRTRRWVGAIPYLATAADWLENVCILSMLLSYPRPLIAMARVKNAMTLTKYLVAGASLGGLCMGGGSLLLRQRSSSHHSHRPGTLS